MNLAKKISTLIQIFEFMKESSDCIALSLITFLYHKADAFGVLFLFGSLKSTWYNPNRRLYPLAHSKLSIRVQWVYPTILQPSLIAKFEIDSLIKSNEHFPKSSKTFSSDVLQNCSAFFQKQLCRTSLFVKKINFLS